MKKYLYLLLFALMSLPSLAQGPVITMSSSAVAGPAPLQATLSAQCDTCVKYSWNSGDGGLIPGPTTPSSAMYIYSKVGAWTASVTGTDMNGLTATATLPITTSLVPLGENDYCSLASQWLGAQTDAVANLPQHCMYTGLNGTPSPGAKITVSSPTLTALNFAVSQASCGDTIIIPASFQAIISTWTLPNKACDDEHWITITGGGALPPEHVRLTPCFAGLASLPNMPAYPCPTPVASIPKLITKNSAPVIAFALGANHYRFIGLELTRQTGNGINYVLVTMNGADHIIVDRVWMHGSSAPADESKRGVALTDSTNIAIINSYLNEFKCISITGACSDAQAIAGGDGKSPVEGTWKIYNNLLSSSTENILFGGGGSGVATPFDIEIRENHLYRPDVWNPKNPAYTPPAIGSKGYVVKNGWEIKNAGRVLFEGNTVEYTWGGFSQTGWAFLYTPRGTWGQAVDITNRFNKYSHSGSGIQAGASKAASPGDGTDSKAAYGWTIHDNVIDDVDSVYFNGSGQALQLGSEYTINRPLHDVSIFHNTILNSTDPGNLMTLGVQPNPVPVQNIYINDNILRAALKFNVWSIGAPGMICPRSGQPWAMFNQCWQKWSVASNVVIGYAAPIASLHFGFFPGNSMTTDPIGTAASVQFANFNGGKDGDYHLQPTSPYHNAATDGRDMGANIDAVNAAVKVAN